MSDDDLDQETETPPAEKPKRRRRVSTTPPQDKRPARFTRRADKARDTLRGLIRIGRPDLDIDGKTFAEIVDRDAQAWGEFIAQAAEWFTPLGAIVDLVFGQPILVLLKLGPSIRAARRDLATRRARIQAEREQARLEQEQPDYPQGSPE